MPNRAARARRPGKRELQEERDRLRAELRQALDLLSSVPTTRAGQTLTEAIKAVLDERARLRMFVSSARVFCLNPDRINQLRLEEALAEVGEWPYVHSGAARAVLEGSNDGS